MHGLNCITFDMEKKKEKKNLDSQKSLLDIR